MEDGTCNVVCFNSLKHIESLGLEADYPISAGRSTCRSAGHYIARALPGFGMNF